MPETTDGARVFCPIKRLNFARLYRSLIDSLLSALS
jgi:hypothetical protein